MSPVNEMVGGIRASDHPRRDWFDNGDIVKGIHDLLYTKKSKTLDVIEMDGVPI